MAKVDIVDILAKLANRQNGAVRNESAFGKYEISQSRRGIDDFIHGFVSDLVAGREIKDSKAVKCHVFWQSEECLAGDL